MTGPESFSFLHVKRRLTEPSDWRLVTPEELWVLNLHYFDDLNAAEASARRRWHEQLIARWISENAVGTAPGWEPYPLSVRLSNWIEWALRGGCLTTAATHSLAMQARLLQRTVEWELLNNHLITNGKALVFAGLFFCGSEAEGWLHRGMQVLRQTLSEQILADGGHFERSPMYHSVVLKDLLDVLNIFAVYGPASEHLDCLGRIRSATTSMREWLQAMVHPDGEIAFFNDATMGMAVAPRALEDYALRLGLPRLNGRTSPITWLRASGYVRFQSGPMVAIIDLGDVGPRHNPGHAHAQTLSFEMSLFDQRLIVNLGTSTYANTAQRQWERSTAAHSTVEIDGQSSSEVWHRFRVARRARSKGIDVHLGDFQRVSVVGQHDGYRRLPGRVDHHRRWLLSSDSLEVHDEIAGRFQTATAHFHLHPAVKDLCLSPANNNLAISVGGQRIVCEADSPLDLIPSNFHPAFGHTMPCKTIRAPFHRPKMSTVWRWS